MPDRTAINKRVQDMGILPGKEFGKKANELLEQAYAKIANELPRTCKMVFGNSVVEYKLSTVQ
jgi:hypothetical protein